MNIQKVQKTPILSVFMDFLFFLTVKDGIIYQFKKFVNKFYVNFLNLSAIVNHMVHFYKKFFSMCVV